MLFRVFIKFSHYLRPKEQGGTTWFKPSRTKFKPTCVILEPIPSSCLFRSMRSCVWNSPRCPSTQTDFLLRCIRLPGEKKEIKRIEFGRRKLRKLIPWILGNTWGSLWFNFECLNVGSNLGTKFLMRIMYEVRSDNLCKIKK